MKRNLIIAGVLVAISATPLLFACSPTMQGQVNTALQSPAGQLFCAVETGGGGQIVVGLINAAVTGAGAPIAVLATGATKNFVDAACAAAAPKGGVPVSPPAGPVPQVAIIPPKV